MMSRMMSLAVTPKGSSPSTLMRKVLGVDCGRVCVAMTCSTSLVPMPNARAPKAPCVEVCESPQTMVMPGFVAPSSGPIMCTMPCEASCTSKNSTPNSAQFLRSAFTCAADTWSAMTRRSCAEVVGTLWSTVAMWRSGRRSLRPAMRRPSKACGDVTSWTSWRSMYRIVGSPSGSATTWFCQTFSNMVRGCGVVLVFAVFMMFNLVSVARVQFGAARRLIVERCGIWLRSDGVGPDERRSECVGSAVRLNEGRVLDVRHHSVRGCQARIPVRNAFAEGEREVVGGECATRVDPEVVIRGGLVGRVGLRRPIDRGEDEEWMRRAEVEPEQAVRRAEVRNAAVDGDVTQEEEWDHGVKRLTLARLGSPERLWLVEVVRKQRVEARVEMEIRRATDGLGSREGPEPLQRIVWLCQRATRGVVRCFGAKSVGACDLRAHPRTCCDEQREGGELESVAHCASWSIPRGAIAVCRSTPRGRCEPGDPSHVSWRWPRPHRAQCLRCGGRRPAPCRRQLQWRGRLLQVPQNDGEASRR